jgi:hypothetical protein
MFSGKTLCILCLVVGCGGGGSDKPVKNANDECPEGMSKQGGDCVAPEGESGPGHASTASTGTSTGASTSAGTTTAPAGDKTPYDKEAVELVLRRAAGQVQGHCGAASDENGKANGPWGKTKASVVLGRNGHVRAVTVPELYADKPVGVCVQHAFQNLIYPPYAAPADVTVEWDIEIVRPAGK